ncbi:hypothetical protein AgCh_030575 [Apium graveolens]
MVNVHRALVDTGRSADVLTYDAYKKLGLLDKELNSTGAYEGYEDDDLDPSNDSKVPTPTGLGFLKSRQDESIVAYNQSLRVAELGNTSNETVNPGESDVLMEEAEGRKRDYESLSEDEGDNHDEGKDEPTDPTDPTNPNEGSSKPGQSKPGQKRKGTKKRRSKAWDTFDELPIGEDKVLIYDGRVCLTSDLWTSIATDGYIIITAHYITDDWVLHKKLLNFLYMPAPHTGITIADKINKLLCEWNLEFKLFSITLDNASSNDAFVNILRTQLNLRNALLNKGQFFHIRCCAHILNLIVRESLKDMDDYVVKVRESVKYIKGSQGRKEKFRECIEQVALSRSKGLRQDVPTRWNSTCIMLDSTLYYRRAFSHLKLSDSNYKHDLDDEEWNKVEGIYRIPTYTVVCEPDAGTSLQMVGSDIMKEFDALERDLNSVEKTELEKYLEEKRLNKSLDIDILEYWNSNQFRFF